MRIAFIGDVHANLLALKAVLKDASERKVDAIYCLGDIVGYGPDPDEVVKAISRYPCVAGNYDDAVGHEKSSCGCEYKPGRESEVGDISLNWTIENTKVETKHFLRGLPKRLSIEIEGVRILLVHASPLDELYEYVTPNTPSKRFEELAKSFEEDVVVSGHTHLPMAKYCFGKMFFNCGSVGRPKDGDNRSCYLLLNVERGVIDHQFVRVKYDVKSVCERIVKAGLPLELALVLALGESYDMGKGKVEFFVR
ncbi:metallophosphoesterase family protein [Pseudothermotoga sp.]|uniref:metallophosphoesterase family protein n=1 Tax=Pseudothermotoga sp. TaxID=2033661 RepID=UPI0031F635F4